MWNIIESLNWKERCKERYGYYAIKRELMKTYSRDVCAELYQFVRARFHELYQCVNSFEEYNNVRVGDYGGDDSFGDMLNHVIGLGEAKFNEVMKDPRTLDGMHYVESFSYSLPYSDDDWQLVDVNAWERKAYTALKELNRIAGENNPNNEDKDIIWELTQRFLAIINRDYETVVKGFDKMMYNRYYKFEANDCMALFSNRLNDFKMYMV